MARKLEDFILSFWVGKTFYFQAFPEKQSLGIRCFKGKLVYNINNVQFLSFGLVLSTLGFRVYDVNLSISLSERDKLKTRLVNLGRFNE